MKRRMRFVAVLLGLVSATALTGHVAFADAHGDGKGPCYENHHGRPGGHFKEMMKKLGLSPEQKAQVKAQFEKGRADLNPVFKNLMAERRQLRTLVMSGTANEAAIRAQAAKVAAIQSDLAVQKAAKVRQFQAILTPEQRTKLQAMHAEREAEREARFQKFMTRGPGAGEEGCEGPDGMHE